MQASLSAVEEAPAMAAPPTIVSQQPPAGPVAVVAPHAAGPVAAATLRTADPFADGAGQPQRPVVATAAPRQPANAASTRGRFDSEFPALHEWRGVRANSPVSLAVGNTAPATINEPPEHPVQHAIATESAASGNRAPLLARAVAERDQMFAAGQGTSLFSGELRTPALASASHPDLQPIAVPSPPPLDVAPRKTGVAAATAGAGRTSGGGLVWWVLGGLAVLTGGAALKYRQQPAGRR
jgi:hypothetical protein